MLSMEEKKELRPPFQLSLIMKRLEYSENSCVQIYQILTDICKKQGKEHGTQITIKAVELMESGATEAEVIEALSKT